MQVVEPDFERRIDLPGAGLCPRPVDIDQGVTGFADLVSLRVYSFAAGIAIDGEAEGDELFVILMRGAIDLAVTADGQAAGTFALDRAGGTRAIYMPPGSAYHLTATAASDVAYARVRGGPASDRRPAGFAASGGKVAGRAVGMTFQLVTLGAGETLALGGADAGERLVHLRTAAGGRAVVGGTPLGDWQTVGLDRAEDRDLVVGEGEVDALLIAAA